MRSGLAWLLPLAALHLTTSAVAQPAPRQGASKRPASALGSPRDPAPPLLPSAGPAAPSEADTALLRSLLFALEPSPSEIRVLAVEDLALLGDPRALNPLAVLVFDSNPAVQAAAVRTIAHFAEPRAEEVLTNVIRHPTVPERIKLLAVEGLVLQRTGSAREFLERLGSSTAFGYTLQSAARKAAHQWGPLPER